MRKIPMRKCVVTNEHYPKKELIRIVRTPEGTVEVDTTGKKNGHGAYLKPDREVIDTARKKKVLKVPVLLSRGVCPQCMGMDECPVMASWLGGLVPVRSSAELDLISLKGSSLQ